MSISDRLKEERERIGLNQADFAARGGASKHSQLDWEKGRATPNCAFMEAVAELGVDVRYVITGRRDYTPPPPLSVDDQRVLQLFKLASPGVRRAALALLATGELPTAAPRRGEATVFIHPDAKVGSVLHGDQVVRGHMHVGDVVTTTHAPAPAVKRVRKPRIDR